MFSSLQQHRCKTPAILILQDSRGFLYAFPTIQVIELVTLPGLFRCRLPVLVRINLTPPVRIRALCCCPGGSAYGRRRSACCLGRSACCLGRSACVLRWPACRLCISACRLCGPALRMCRSALCLRRPNRRRGGSACRSCRSAG